MRPWAAIPCEYGPMGAGAFVVCMVCFIDANGIDEHARKIELQLKATIVRIKGVRIER